MAQQCRQMNQVCRPQPVLWLLTALQSCQTVQRCCRWESPSLMARQSDSLLGRLSRPLVLLCCQPELQANQMAMQHWTASAWVRLMEQRCWQLLMGQLCRQQEQLSPWQVRPFGCSTT